MTCEDLEPLLHPFVDGEVDGPERFEIESHLAACPRCQASVAEHQRYKHKLREVAVSASLLNPPAPERLRQNLRRTLREEPVPVRPLWRRPRVVYPALAAFASAAAGMTLYLQSAAISQTDRVMSDAVRFHQRELPLEVQALELPQIQSWFKGKVDFAPTRIPTVRNVNLIGARLSNVGNRQAAYMTYGTPSQRRVSLFVFDAPDLTVPHGRRIADRDVLIANQRGYNVALWKDHEIAYSLVGDLSEQDILELVAATAP